MKLVVFLLPFVFFESFLFAFSGPVEFKFDTKGSSVFFGKYVLLEEDNNDYRLSFSEGNRELQLDMLGKVVVDAAESSSQNTLLLQFEDRVDSRKGVLVTFSEGEIIGRIDYTAYRLDDNVAYIIEIVDVSESGSFFLAKCAVLKKEGKLTKIRHKWAIFKQENKRFKKVQSKQVFSQWGNFSEK